MERKGILKTSLIITLLLTLIFAANQIDFSRFFPISTVRVYGLHHVDHEEIQESLLPLVNNGFFYVNVDSIRERLLQMPWIADIYVRRQWPNQLEISVIEKQAVAYWGNNSLLSDSGEFFTPNKNTYPEKLPLFEGPDGTQQLLLKNYQEMNRVFTALHARISQLELTPYATWKIKLDNGLTLQIGHKDILTHLSQFVKVYPKIVGAHVGDVDYIDLRYPNGMAVRWKTTRTVPIS